MCADNSTNSNKLNIKFNRKKQVDKSSHISPVTNTNSHSHRPSPCYLPHYAQQTGLLRRKLLSRETSLFTQKQKLNFKTHKHIETFPPKKGYFVLQFRNTLFNQKSLVHKVPGPGRWHKHTHTHGHCIIQTESAQGLFE